MIGFRLSQAKGLFFDRKAVINATTAASRRNLSRFGAFVRTRARRSIRKRKDVSLPGQPPSSHTDVLRKGVLFVYESEQRSVIIGPVKLNKVGNAPEALEHGGLSETLVGQGRKRRRRRIRVRARPFMRPAFVEESKKLDPLWRNSIR